MCNRRDLSHLISHVITIKTKTMNNEADALKSKTTTAARKQCATYTQHVSMHCKIYRYIIIHFQTHLAVTQIAITQSSEWDARAYVGTLKRIYTYSHTRSDVFTVWGKKNRRKRRSIASCCRTLLVCWNYSLDQIVTWHNRLSCGLGHNLFIRLVRHCYYDYTLRFFLPLTLDRQHFSFVLIAFLGNSEKITILFSEIIILSSHNNYSWFVFITIT